MDLPAPLGWLVDEAGVSPGPESFLAELGGRLLAVLLAADLRDFTAMSEATDPAKMIAALDAW